MTSVEERLDEIAARAEGTPSGPWCASEIAYNQSAEEPETIVVHTGRFDWRDLTSGDSQTHVATLSDWSRDSFQVGQFIAHARTDVPRLVAALRAVLAEADRLEHVLTGAQVRSAISSALGGDD